MTDYIKQTEQALYDYLPDLNCREKELIESMKYSLEAGGKRVRPNLVFSFNELCNGKTEAAVPFAYAVEMIHTYSLIHDDLPCMDNDDMRRGKPSCHKQFGEETALLAGDALLTHAFEIAADCDLPDDRKIMAISLLSQNSGVCGMIGGQVIDLITEKNDNPSLRELLTVYKLKTGALISAACLMGCISAGANDEQLAAASKFAYSLGIAFQIQDDILDIIGDEEKLGKPVGSDKENNKTTYAMITGIEKAKEDVKRLTESAVRQLDYFENTDFLKLLSYNLVNREK